MPAPQEETHTHMDAKALQLIIPIAGLAAVLFALYLARDVLRRDQGPQAMQDVADTILEGAVAFIRRQYRTIAVMALFASVILGAIIATVETKDWSAPPARWPAGSSACTSASRRTYEPHPRRSGASSKRSRSRCAVER
jgi:hypothetical protein